MQMVAEAAGASKETLYRHFASKELLLAEIVGRKATLISGPNAAIEQNAPADQVLFAFGVGLLCIVLRDQSACLFRTVVAEAARSPKLGDLFYSRGPGVTTERFAAYLSRAPLSQAPQAVKFISRAEGLTKGAQRIVLSSQPLAPEFKRSDISPIFKANGSLSPDDPAYLAKELAYVLKQSRASGIFVVGGCVRARQGCVYIRVVRQMCSFGRHVPHAQQDILRKLVLHRKVPIH